jgi:hypothetical protein
LEVDSDVGYGGLVGVSMLSVITRRATRPVRIHPALWRAADECGNVMVRLTAYVGILAIVAIAAARAWDQLPLAISLPPVAKPGWSVATRSFPAFAVSQPDSSAKMETYEILRHPEGGRKDVLRWAASADEKPTAELELYRTGDERDQVAAPAAEIAARMDPTGTRELAGEGIVDSKFGPVALFGFADSARDANHCLGFAKNLDAADFRISGWSCQGTTLPVRRLAIACTLNRLILLTAGNDPKLAELFARAELKRGSCPSGDATLSADWVTGAQNPRLRGSL